VRLMSIHAAKGLEFPVVCVADLGRAPNTTVPDLLVRDERVGLRLVGLEDAEATCTLDFDALAEERARAQSQEEERILYVAMTRARERLLLSGAVNFERWPGERPRAPAISWLGPALCPELPAIVAALERPVCDLPVAGVPSRAGVRAMLSAPATVGAVLQRRAPEADGAANGADESARAQAEPARAEGQLALDFGAGAGRETSAAGAARGALAAGDRSQSARLGPGDSLSYTALSELERCGYRYYLERVLRLRESRPEARTGASGEGLQARMRGTLVHRLLESLDYSRPRAPSAGQLSELARELDVRLRAREREEILSLVGSVSDAALSGSGPAARLAAARGVRSEYPFAFSLGPSEPLINGVIDVLAREDDGGCLVIDYKSDRVGAHEDLPALVAREYEVQRLVYALAVLRDGAPRVEVVHWFLERPLGWVAGRYDSGDRGELEELLRARIEGAHARMFAVSEHPHRGLCETCPGRAALCSWTAEMTLRENPGA